MGDAGVPLRRHILHEPVMACHRRRPVHHLGILLARRPTVVVRSADDLVRNEFSGRETLPARRQTQRFRRGTMWTAKGANFTAFVVRLDLDQIDLGPAARTFQMFGANVIVQINSAGAGHLQSPKTDDSLPGVFTRTERRNRQPLIV